MQTTSHLLMIRPVQFGYNAETAVNNAFQVKTNEENTQQQALKEFDAFASLLQENGVDVTVINDTITPHTPDSIFPNNWISFHQDGSLLLYPMFAVNRRAERKENIWKQIGERFQINQLIDLSGYEEKNLFLEGTGSMVLDRENHLAYACLSPRTDAVVLEDFCKRMNYESILFTATDANGNPIYHTNVMMCVADRYIVICLDSIANSTERENVIAHIMKTGKQVIPITLGQMNQFAGNMLQVENAVGEKLLVMSSQAYMALNSDQRKKLSSFNRILHSPLDTIETNGGGSARCMMAEIHLPEKFVAS